MSNASNAAVAAVFSEAEQPQPDNRRLRKHLKSFLKLHGFEKTVREGAQDQAPLSETWELAVQGGRFSLYIAEFSSAVRGEIKAAIPRALQGVHNGKSGLYFGNEDSETYLTFTPGA